MTQSSWIAHFSGPRFSWIAYNSGPGLIVCQSVSVGASVLPYLASLDNVGSMPTQPPAIHLSYVDLITLDAIEQSSVGVGVGVGTGTGTGTGVGTGTGTGTGVGVGVGVGADPKFSFDLTIHDLTNVPEINGSCYIEISVKDSQRKGHSNGKIPGIESDKKVLSSSSPRSFFAKFDDASLKKNKNGNNGVAANANTNANTTLSGNISTTTSRKKLHNFKCNFNYNLSCNLKFSLKRKHNLISNKYLKLKVFYVVDKHSGGGNGGGGGGGNGGNSPQVIFLGRLVLNLAEYLNFNEPVNTKYLLEDSRVNSILNITIGLSELPANFDFHTQLQIQDNNSSNTSSTSTSLGDGKTHMRKTTTFNVPEFERKHVFTGINYVFGENNNNNVFPNDHLHSPAPSVKQRSPSSEKPSPIDKHSHRGIFGHYNNNNNINNSNNNSNNNNQKPNSDNSSASSNVSGKQLDSIANLDNDELLHYVAKNNDNSSGLNLNNIGNIPGSESYTNPLTNNQAYNNTKKIIMDPIVSLLYAKILESNWDPELYPLLEYSPSQCINDIFENANNPLGCNTKLKAYADAKWKEREKSEDDSYRELNGLISELKYRSNIKSWKVSEQSLDEKY
ncbi:hypothetical protein KGF56_000678 [Candida oxycetoniae]|uniref:C2 NT-type domain-containing protein n=1 Tax=Candida oxycetoniae TaxID=497107 RepID=A0AAI9T0E3_9ASCO|nr:uncharacterized protein KGF56_000678 [Candida oxycetoniae]KAI3406546.2 hypothetical protein KGF56_000678 [Candida oxycetoniae]